MSNTAPTFTLDDLRYLAEQGGRFCKVLAHDKRPFEDAWQTTPYPLSGVLDHLKSGGNVGLVCGELSNNIGMLDADEGFSLFVAAFPELAKSATITRPGADKGKILIRVSARRPPARSGNITRKSPRFLSFYRPAIRE